MKSDTYLNLNKIIPNISKETFKPIIDNHFIRKFGSKEVAEKYFFE